MTSAQKQIVINVKKLIGMEKFLEIQNKKGVDWLHFITKINFSGKLTNVDLHFEPVLQGKNLVISLVKKRQGGA